MTAPGFLRRLLFCARSWCEDREEWSTSIKGRSTQCRRCLRCGRARVYTTGADGRLLNVEEVTPETGMRVMRVITGGQR